MAVFKSTEITAKESFAGNKYNANTLAAKVRTAEFNYTSVGTEAAADVIELVELPLTADVIGYSFTNEDFGTATGDLGTTSGGQELAAALALGTAGNYSGFRGPIRISSTGKIYLEVLTATLDAAKDIRGVIYYTINA